jgi:CRP/FNR family transcriptional regulator, cyclic AMP receptor protein
VTAFAVSSSFPEPTSPLPLPALAGVAPVPPRTGSAPCAGAEPVRLLDHLPDLAADLAAEQRALAHRALQVAAIEIGRGRLEDWGCDALPSICGEPFGLVVVEGLLAREVALGDRTSTSLYGPGDVFDLNTDESSSLATGGAVICPDDALVAVLDDRLLAAMREWPRMISRLFAIAMRQLERADLNAAIGQLERVEDRLLGFFWLLADRWGRRGRAGIAIEQPLTHEAIGHLIGARRPTVSLGLRTLAEQGALTRSPEGTWLLSPDSLDRLIA